MKKAIIVFACLGSSPLMGVAEYCSSKGQNAPVPSYTYSYTSQDGKRICYVQLTAKEKEHVLTALRQHVPVRPIIRTTIDTVCTPEDLNDTDIVRSTVVNLRDKKTIQAVIDTLNAHK